VLCPPSTRLSSLIRTPPESIPDFWRDDFNRVPSLRHSRLTTNYIYYSLYQLHLDKECNSLRYSDSYKVVWLWRYQTSTDSADLCQDFSQTQQVVKTTPKALPNNQLNRLQPHKQTTPQAPSCLTCLWEPLVMIGDRRELGCARI